jgi:hypothetical protein
MPAAKYRKPRPPLTAEIRRAVEVESGHACAVTRCNEHTYVEIHHINGDREDNRVQNLVLLCDKHHKMAHAGVIDRKALREYKRLLNLNYNKVLLERLERLEALVAQAPKAEPEISRPAAVKEDPGVASKIVAPRPELMSLTLEQLALSKFERDTGLLLDRMPRFSKGKAQLRLDALRQDDELPEDLVVEVRWLRKRYLDAPIWVRQVEAATETYELITGRKARGVLIFVVPKESMKDVRDLPLTLEELRKIDRKPEIRIYTYAELGFDPGAITAGLFTTNLRHPDAAV